MKIVTWNCNGALRKKFERLIDIDADILIIQECENPAVAIDKEYIKWSENYLWIGDTKNRGLGVFAKTNLKLSKLDWPDIYKDHRVKYFLPFKVNDQFEVLAVWTHQNNSPNFGYVGQLWKYLQVNKSKLNDSIVIGDFNSNTIWDEWDRWWNHSDVVNELNELGIISLYHKFTNEKQGQETQFTFYLHRKFEKPYHIDYCFASQKFVKKLKNVTIECYENWQYLSDHSPMIISFED